MLAENAIGGTGTLRANRTDKYPIKDDKAIRKESYGTYDFRYDSANKILVVRWNASHEVKKKKMLDIPEPSLVNITTRIWEE